MIEEIKARLTVDPDFADALDNLLKEYRCIKCNGFSMQKCPHPAYKCYLHFKANENAPEASGDQSLPKRKE